ncbi:MAG TPA: hypothetical protein VFU22_24435 [Roseiflexaceae bacterium]|nr:hypothetical protein [Roseiflexaceae bacterium]
MDILEQRANELRAEIVRLKDALQSATNEAERFELHAQINTCIRESLALIDQRLQASRAANAIPPYERQVGDG